MVDSKFDRIRLDKAALLAEVVKLQTDRAYRDSQKLFFIEGVRNFIQAKTANFSIATIVYSEKLLIVPPARQLVRSLRREGIPTVKLSPEEFRKISRTPKASGIAAIVRQRWLKLHQLSPQKNLCWFALERVRSPGNLGTLIRSSEAIGGGGFILLGNSIDPYAPDVIRSSMGALYRQSYIRTSYDSLSHWLRRHHCVVVGASVGGKFDFQHFRYPKSPIIFLGEERKGLSHRQQNLCQHLVKIPMVCEGDSLNLAVAGSLLLYEVYRSKA